MVYISTHQSLQMLHLQYKMSLFSSLFLLYFNNRLYIKKKIVVMMH